MARIEINPVRKSRPVWPASLCGAFEATDIDLLHQSIDLYEPTPLVSLPGLAAKLGAKDIFLKDESHRFGLGAFKALGGSYAIYRFLSERLVNEGREVPPAEEFYQKTDFITPGEFTFCTATDGNHGRGVAWAAARLRQKARIYMSSSSVPVRIDKIRREGAEVILVEGSYEAAVKASADDAAANGWQVISDAAYEGYMTIPLWISAGYMTIFREIASQLPSGCNPDFVLVPSGVGALAATAGYYYRNETAKLVSVEPDGADCCLRSILSSGHRPVLIEKVRDTIMACLLCGIPSPAAWPFLRDRFDFFMNISDDECQTAMKTCYYSEGGDPRVISGQSGAATMGGLLALAADSQMRARTGLGADSVVLLLSTEGNVDPDGFAQLVGQPG